MKMKMILNLIIAGLLVIITAVLGVALTTPAHGAGAKNLRDCDGTYSGTYKNVTVLAGSTCVLTADATVLGNVHAKKGAANLYVYTAVGHNIHAMGVTGTVHVGPSGCKYDPEVGNNLMVKKSHNVLICWVSAKNNIRVSGNDGRITVRSSSAGSNIGVDRNLAYNPQPGDDADGHRHPGRIHIFGNTAGHHITAKHNKREVVAHGNSPAVTY